MQQIFLNFGIILLTIFGAFFIFIIYLSIMDYPGGSVGMAPIMILYTAAISLIPTLATIVLLRFKRILEPYMSILIFMVAYFCVSYFYIDIHPFDSTKSQMYRNVHLGIYISLIISSVLILVFDKFRKKFPPIA